MRANYYAKVARSVGVPDFWIEDSVQEVALACWLAGADTATIVRRTAIDCARRWGPHSRRGIARPALVALEAARDLTTPDDSWRDDWITFQAMVAPMLAKRRQMAAEVSAARRHVRRALAA